MESISKSKRDELWKKYISETDPEDREDVISVIPVQERLKSVSVEDRLSNLTDAEYEEALKLIKEKMDKKKDQDDG